MPCRYSLCCQPPAAPLNAVIDSSFIGKVLASFIYLGTKTSGRLVGAKTKYCPGPHVAPLSSPKPASTERLTRFEPKMYTATHLQPCAPKIYRLYYVGMSIKVTISHRRFMYMKT